MNDNPAPHAPAVVTLRDLPLAARLTLALFLISVGIGYVSALVQLHFQHASASPGEALPTGDDAIRVFHGERPQSKIEQLLPETSQRPFNGQGQMTDAFFKKSKGWKKDIDARGEDEVRKERATERLAVLAWIKSGARPQDYEQDAFPLPDTMSQQPITETFLVKKDDKVLDRPVVKIRSILKARCARCHKADDSDDGAAAQYPLDTYEYLKPYITVEISPSMSLTKLAQTTHVHLLGFSMLYGLTGLILSFSSYPRLLRLLLCPLPLLAQVVDISFWWLARESGPQGALFARAIVVSGAVVAIGLLLHIVLALFNLFRATGWVILILLFAAAGVAGYIVNERYLDPYLTKEKEKALAPKAE